MRTSMPSARVAQEPPASTPEKLREVISLKLRDEWIRSVAEIESLSPILRVVGMRLAHYYNGKTGQLNPSYATLARKCGTTERTAQKAVAALKSLGWIAPTRTSGGRHDNTNDFTLLIPPRRVSERTPVSAKPRKVTGVQLSGARVSRSVSDGCPGGHPNSVRENSVIEQRGFAARSVLVDRAVTEPKETTADDAAPRLVNDTAYDAALIPETKSAPIGALIGKLGDESKPTTTAPADEYMRSAVARNGNGAAVVGIAHDGNGHAARRAAFEKIKRAYPQSHIRDADENAFDAFELALDVGNTVASMVEDAKDAAACAAEGDEIPELVEFLAQKCWTETSAPLH
jgi:hypothetical protein